MVEYDEKDIDDIYADVVRHGRGIKLRIRI